MVEALGRGRRTTIDQRESIGRGFYCNWIPDKTILVNSFAALARE